MRGLSIPQPHSKSTGKKAFWSSGSSRLVTRLSSSCPVWAVEESADCNTSSNPLLTLFWQFFFLRGVKIEPPVATEAETAFDIGLSFPFPWDKHRDYCCVVRSRDPSCHGTLWLICHALSPPIYIFTQQPDGGLAMMSASLQSLSQINDWDFAPKWNIFSRALLIYSLFFWIFILFTCRLSSRWRQYRTVFLSCVL